MANRRIKVSYGRTCQSAPYESIRLDVSLEKDVDDNAVILDDLNKITNGLRTYVKNKIAETLKNE